MLEGCVGGNSAVKCAVWIIAELCNLISAFGRKFSGERYRGSFAVGNEIQARFEEAESTYEEKFSLPHVESQPLLKIQLRNKLIKI